MGVGHSSSSRALACKGWDHPVEPAWWVHLQFGLFSVPISGPQLVHQRLQYVLSCLQESAYKKSLAAYQKELRQRLSSNEICHNDHMLDVQ